MDKVGFIGAGNMAAALVGGFLKAGVLEAQNVMLSAPTDRNLKKLEHLNIKTTHDNNEVLKFADKVFFSVKPHLLSKVIKDLDPTMVHNHLFVSVLAGVEIQQIQEFLGSQASISPDKVHVIRVMPNTPCQVSQGCCAFTASPNVSDADKAFIKKLLSSVGVCVEVTESQINAVGGLAGSGPAYIYAAIEALADGGVKMGLPRDTAQLLAAQTVKGAATMVLTQNKHPGLLKDEVCSAGGSTIVAMHSLEKNGLRNAMISAVEASTLRAKELGERK